MRSKTILITALTAGLALSLAGSLYATELWLHMNVKEAKGEHVNLNIPLSTAKGMAGLLGAEAHGGKVRMGDKDMDARELRHLWQAVKDSPDANFITVDGPEGKVRIAKSGGYLLIRADETKGHNSRVDIKIPASVIEALISGNGDALNLEAALEALAQHGEGELMTVDDENDTVRMWVDHSAESNGR